MAMKRLCVMAAAVLSALPGVGWADEYHRVAVLGCDIQHNQFVIRFGGFANDTPLKDAEFLPVTPSIANMWKKTELKKEGECTLENGKKILLSKKNGQVFPYGMGGADPDAFFTLKIDDKNIYYNADFYIGYGTGDYVLNAVVYADEKLQECVPDTKDTDAVVCKDVSARLEGKDFSESEKKHIEYNKQRKFLQERLSPFCRSIDASKWENLKYINEYPVLDGMLSEGEIDINNDGKKDKLYSISNDKHYFDGNYLIIFPEKQEKIPEFLKSIKQDHYSLEEQPGIKALPQWDAYVISIGSTHSSTRYINNRPFFYKGINYIYSSETNESQIPASTISELTKDNKIKILCEFP